MSYGIGCWAVWILFNCMLDFIFSSFAFCACLHFWCPSFFSKNAYHSSEFTTHSWRGWSCRIGGNYISSFYISYIWIEVCGVWNPLRDDMQHIFIYHDLSGKRSFPCDAAYSFYFFLVFIFSFLYIIDLMGKNIYGICKVLGFIYISYSTCLIYN